MKFLIWVGCVFSALFANVICAMLLSPLGIRLGFVPQMLIIAGLSVLARGLCYMYERKRISKKATQTGATEVEVVGQKAPASLLKLCEDFKGDKTALKIVIDNAVKEKTISRTEGDILFEEYSK